MDIPEKLYLHIRNRLKISVCHLSFARKMKIFLENYITGSSYSYSWWNTDRKVILIKNKKGELLE